MTADDIVSKRRSSFFIMHRFGTTEVKSEICGLAASTTKKRVIFRRILVLQLCRCVAAGSPAGYIRAHCTTMSVWQESRVRTMEPINGRSAGGKVFSFRNGPIHLHLYQRDSLSDSIQGVLTRHHHRVV